MMIDSAITKFIEKLYPDSLDLRDDCMKALENKEYSLNFELIGTPFQLAVWKEIAGIPFGQTESYSDIAKKVGNPKSVRAVANACGDNPFPIIIPCHRVVGKNDFGGYRYGVKLKKKLQDYERSQLAE